MRYPGGMHPLLRHITACRNATLPGGRLRLHVAGRPVGWVAPDLAARMAGLGASLAGDRVAVADAAGLQSMADRLGLWHRGEAFDMRAEPGEEVVGPIDRGALPAFGIRADGAHLNGLVRRADGLHLWVARRAASKRLDPGKLDHIAAGGVPAGLTPLETLAKEAAEEAGIPAALAATATHAATITYAMERPEGLRRDQLFCYDLLLPPDFTPRPVDGEVESFELWPLPRVLDTVREGDAFKFNVNLVLIDLFLRTGLVRDEALRRALDGRDG